MFDTPRGYLTTEAQRMHGEHGACQFNNLKISANLCTSATSAIVFSNLSVLSASSVNSVVKNPAPSTTSKVKFSF